MMFSNASDDSQRQAVRAGGTKSVCVCSACHHLGACDQNASLYDALIAIPVVEDYLRAFSEATGVSVRTARTTTASSRAVVVPVSLEGRAAAYFIANPPGKSFPPRRRQAIHQSLSVFAGTLSLLANRYLTTPGSRAVPCVVRADEYIRTHFSEPLRIADVARRVGFCADHFGRVFGRETGLTFTNYVARVRVEKAKELLTSTHQRVNEVAFACGFESIPHFNRVFKRLTGQTPSQYRVAQARPAGI